MVLIFLGHFKWKGVGKKATRGVKNPTRSVKISRGIEKVIKGCKKAIRGVKNLTRGVKISRSVKKSHKGV